MKKKNKEVVETPNEDKNKGAKIEVQKEEDLNLITILKENKKIPKEIKKKMLSAIAECAVSAIIAYAYFIFLGLGIKNIHETIYLTDLRVFAVSLSVVAIVFFEKAYKNKSSKDMYRGIEILGLAILTLILEYMIIYLTPNYRIIIPFFGIAYNIYYIFKTGAMCLNIKNQYKKGLNDIKQIIKKEKKI